MVDDHQSTFQYCINIIVTEHEYLYLNIFVHSLEGDAQKWLQGLPTNSIPTWKDFHTTFLNHWVEKRDHCYYLIDFVSLKKKNGEIVSKFNKGFNKMYNKIPVDIRPSQDTAKATYVVDHKP